MSASADDFEPHRRYLAALAYRMLGSVAEADDVVQDAFLRWNTTDRGTIGSPRAFLTRTVTRLCLDCLKSARAQREEYVGTWLPEPLVQPAAHDDAVQIAHDLSVALLVTLERLSPLERAAFLLHDVFDMEFADVAEVLERSEPAVRQLAARAREHVREARPRFNVSEEKARSIADAFGAAMVSGDIAALSKLLAADAVFYADGGGKRQAALHPIYGRDDVSRFFDAIARKTDPDAVSLESVWINGMPGFVVHTVDGVGTLAFEVDGDAVVTIYVVRNPDKLRHLTSFAH